jgi:hypothetical protein
MNIRGRRRACWLSVLLIGVFLTRAAPSAFADDLVTTGNLRFVAATFMTLRLADGRVIDARLPRKGPLAAASLVAQYRLGDRVQIVCKPIRPDFDEAANRSHQLELAHVEYVRGPTPDELRDVRRSLSWQPGENLLKPSLLLVAEPTLSTPASPAGFEAIRTVNLARIEAFPSFLADETATRSRKPKGSADWQPVDTIESEISFQGARAIRRNVRINGKRWQSSSPWLPGANWGLGFGTDLQPLFYARCANEFAAGGEETVRGQQLRVFTFRAPQDGCFGPGTIGYQQYAAEHRGRILVDRAGNVVQVEHEDVGTPPDLGTGSTIVLIWEEIKIGATAYLLPASLDWVWRSDEKGDMWRVHAEYRNHHHFETAVTIRPEKTPGDRK